MSCVDNIIMKWASAHNMRHYEQLIDFCFSSSFIFMASLDAIEVMYEKKRDLIHGWVDGLLKYF